MKLTDFGLCNTVATNDMLKTNCGTLTYIAPEILKGVKYNQAVDMWSVGVISYILLSGYPPFIGQDKASLQQLVMNGKYECKFFLFHSIDYSPDWDEITKDAKDFIAKLLVVDPKERYVQADLIE